MLSLIMRIVTVIVGISLLTVVLVFEIDSIFGFLLATLGLFLIIIGLTVKHLINLIINTLSL